MYFSQPSLMALAADGRTSRYNDNSSFCRNTMWRMTTVHDMTAQWTGVIMLTFPTVDAVVFACGSWSRKLIDSRNSVSGCLSHLPLCHVSPFWRHSYQSMTATCPTYCIDYDNYTAARTVHEYRSHCKEHTCQQHGQMKEAQCQSSQTQKVLMA